MTLFLKRILGRLKRVHLHRQSVKNRLPLPHIQKSLETLLIDCDSPRAHRVVHQIKSARTPGELWELRCDIHQCISHAHDQTEASRRINTLVTDFNGWVSPDKLTPI